MTASRARIAAVQPAAAALRGLVALAWACVLLMAVVTSASAWLRLSAPRAPCAAWPACRAVVEPAPAAPAAPVLAEAPLRTLARAAHRVAASAVLLAALALAWLAARRGRGDARARRAARQALVLVVLALGLAALGVVTPGSRAAAVVLGNLLGGLLMLALAWRLLRGLQGAATGPRLGAWAAPALLAWLAQAALGALAPLQAGPWPQAHLALAAVSLVLAAAAGGCARRGPRRAEGWAVLGLTALQAAAGLAAAAAGAAPVMVWWHNLGAAAGLALLAGLAKPPRAGR